jgi:hypothetical protein
MKLAVINPGGNDPDQIFPDGAGEVTEHLHPPVNYHAYAACTRGGFYRKEKSIPGDHHHVLLLLRRDLKRCAKALFELKRAGKQVAVSIKESGAHQVAQLLSSCENLTLFQKICAEADGAISSTPDLVPVYQAAGARHVEFLPTPYPVDDPGWNFSLEIHQRRGVFIGTREFDVPSRNHAAALLLGESLADQITVLNIDGRKGRQRLQAFPKIRVSLLSPVDGATQDCVSAGCQRCAGAGGWRCAALQAAMYWREWSHRPPAGTRIRQPEKRHGVEPRDAVAER